MLTVAVTARTLFHMEDGNRVFQEQGQAAFNKYMYDRRNIPLRPGAAFPLAMKLRGLKNKAGKPLARLQLLSRSSPVAGLRVMNSVQHYELPCEQAAFTREGDRFLYANSFKAKLFLSANAKDTAASIKAGIPAATLIPRETSESDAADSTLRVAFDGDSVIFSDASDKIYLTQGLEKFRDHEVLAAETPLELGPFWPLFRELHEIQAEVGSELLRVMLLTARGLPAHGRVITTLIEEGIELDELVFAGGDPKGPILQAFKADIFFDDSQKNIDSALGSNILGGHVPYGSGGIVVPAAA